MRFSCTDLGRSVLLAPAFETIEEEEKIVPNVEAKSALSSYCNKPQSAIKFRDTDEDDKILTFLSRRRLIKVKKYLELQFLKY